MFCRITITVFCTEMLRMSVSMKPFQQKCQEKKSKDSRGAVVDLILNANVASIHQGHTGVHNLYQSGHPIFTL